MEAGCSQSPVRAPDTDDSVTAPVIREALHTASRIPSPQAKACAQCHKEQFEQWQNSQHAWANRLVSLEKDGAAFTPARKLVHGSFTTEMGQQGDAFEFRVEGKGDPSVHHAEAVIGIAPLLQYLVPFPGGRLQVVDVSYDPRSNDWFNAFGDEDRQPHEWGFWKNRSMNWNSRCATCHMTGFQKNYDIETDSYNSTWDEMGVSCAQCHRISEQLAVNSEQCPVVPRDHSPSDPRLPAVGVCHSRSSQRSDRFNPAV